MPLQKQQVAVNFQKGLDTKSDPWQVPIGNFLELENSIFTKQGLLQKRNGFEQIGQINDDSVCSISTFNNELTAIGSSIYAYNQPNETFTNQGSYFPTKFNRLPLINNSGSQSSVDSVSSPNGLTCVVYREAIASLPEAFRIAVIDSSTGQNVLAPFDINSNGGAVFSAPRVVYFQNNFVVIFPVDTAGTYSIKYLKIGCSNLVVSTAQIVAPSYTPTTAGEGLPWDCVASLNGIAVGYNVAGLGFYVNYILPGFTVTTPAQIDALHQCTCVGATTDFNNCYFAYFSKSTGNGYIVAVNLVGGVVTAIFAPQLYINVPPVVSTIFVINITATVNNSDIFILSEIQFPYDYGALSSISNLYSNQVVLNKCSTVGVVDPTTTTLFKGAGLASKAISILDQNYFLICFDDGPIKKRSLQACYFLANTDGKIINRFSYRNGSGYVYNVLPSMTANKYFGTATQNSNVINNIADTSTLKVGDRIIGENLPVNGVYITEIVSVNEIKISAIPSIVGSVSIYFCKNFIEVSYLQAISKESYNAQDVIAEYYRFGSFLGQIELYNQQPQSVETAKNLILSGGFLWGYDGYQVTENNFFIFPSQISVEGYVLSSGAVPSGNLVPQTVPGFPNYQYLIFYEWTDNQGNVQVSDGVEVTGAIYQNVNVTGDLAINSNTIINISNINALQTGMVVANANIATGSGAISQINYSSNTIVLTQIATANSAGAALTCTARTSNVLYIPTLRLSYKTDVRILIYRWSETFQFYSSVVSPTSPILNDPTVNYIVFEDTVDEADIKGNSTAYTTTALPNTSISCCDAMTIFDNRVWVVNSENKNLLNYSKQILAATPVEMVTNFNFFVSPTQTMQGNSGPITALNVLDDKLIIFKNNSLYYINGIGPDNFGVNNQYSEPILISATIGCSNPNSIVVIPSGLVMQGNKGIWILGRDLNTAYIGAPVEAYTQNALVTSAEVIPATNQVRFMLNTGVTLVYDYYYNQWGTFTGIPSVDSTIYEGLHTFINRYGNICREKPGNYLDISNPVLMSFKTNWFALGGLQGYQRAYFLFLLGKYYSPHKLNVELAYDFNDGFTQSTLITPDNYAPVFGGDPVYGASEVWGGPTQVEKWRIMLTKQKCDSVQIKISEIYDPSFGVTAGEGLTLSGMNFIIGVKKGYGPITQFNTAG